MKFEWDETKRALNIAKHGIDMTNAAELDWHAVRVVPDLRRNYGESRFLAYGVLGNRLHVVAFTDRSGVIRVISMRKANEREIKRYGETQSRNRR